MPRSQRNNNDFLLVLMLHFSICNITGSTYHRLFIPTIEFNGTHDHLSLSFENNLISVNLNWTSRQLNCLHFILFCFCVRYY